MKKLVDVKDLEALAKFVDEEYENTVEPTGEFEAICPICYKNTIAEDHKKNCVYGIASRILKLIN